MCRTMYAVVSGIKLYRGTLMRTFGTERIVRCSTGVDDDDIVFHQISAVGDESGI